MGQRRGKIDVKRAKNFHLLMKGKITHLALAVQLSQRRAGFLRSFLNTFAVLGLNRNAIHIWLSRPHFHFLWMCSEPGLQAIRSRGALADSDQIANILERINIF